MSGSETSGPRCDRCRHWGLSNDHEPDAAAWAIPEIAFKACGAIRHRRLYEAACGVGDGRPAMQRARAIVTDGDDYFAIVVTGPDFFCALFQPKEPA